MSKGLIFFCCACAIIVFTTINLSVGPSIFGRLGNAGTLNCVQKKDEYDSDKADGVNGDSLKYGAEWNLNRCNNLKGMYNMEYTSFIFDIVIGFICGLLGLLHLFDVKKEYVSKTGLIGLGCGIIGFVLSFVYVIFNGIVYTSNYTGVIKRDSDGVFAEKKGDIFECLYFDSKENTHALYATYSDLIQKQYNYDKDLTKAYIEDSNGCYVDDSTLFSLCRTDGKIPASGYTNCQKLYAEPEEEILNKDMSDRFLTTLLLSLFVCLSSIGLSFYGFLLFRTPSEF